MVDMMINFFFLKTKDELEQRYIGTSSNELNSGQKVNGQMSNAYLGE